MGFARQSGGAVQELQTIWMRFSDSVTPEAMALWETIQAAAAGLE